MQNDELGQQLDHVVYAFLYIKYFSLLITLMPMIQTEYCCHFRKIMDSKNFMILDSYKKAIRSDIVKQPQLLLNPFSLINFIQHRQ